MADTLENTLVFGLGGLGAIVSRFLAISEQTKLSTVARSNFEIVKTSGIKIESESTPDLNGVVKFDQVFPPLEKSKPGQTNLTVEGDFSFVVVTSKALFNVQPSLVQCLEPFVGPKTTIVLIQNGVGIEDAVHRRWGSNLILTCIAYIGGTQTSPGVVAHGGGRLLSIGPFHADGSSSYTPHEKERIDKFAQMARIGGAKTTAFYDHIEMQADRWKKLSWNAAWNGFSTLTNLDTDTYLASSPSAEKVVRRLMREIAAVARALGIEIDPEDKPVGERLEDIHITRVRSVGPLTTSMRTDLQNGRSLEADVIFGVPLRHAQRLELDTPVLETMWATINAIDGRNSGRITALV